MACGDRADAVDPAVQRVEPAPFHAILDGMHGYSCLDELAERHDAVLPGRECHDA